MSKKPPFSILINSSDGFADCWHPFFELFSRYWQRCEVPILLNTERKDWHYSGLDLHCTRVQERQAEPRRLTWSECLLAALGQVETPLVLYLQEDYFIERPINTGLIHDLAAKMSVRSDIKHIGLTHFGSCGLFTGTDDPRLWQISQRARYRISTQAALWRVDTLRSYLRPQENGWMFEIFGTRRAHKRKELFLTVNRDLYAGQGSPVIFYLHTGIIKGQWHPGIREVFDRHGIRIEYDERGFFKPKPWLVRKWDVARKLAEHPVYALRNLLI